MNIVEVPRSSGQPQLLVHAVPCCDCGRAIRSSFYGCSEGCIHYDKIGKSRCSFAKHQYNACVHCYLTTHHTKQHLRKIRPYDPMAVGATASIDERTKSRLTKEIRNLQEQIDKEEDFQDGNRRLQAIFRIVLEWARRVALPFGNVHARIMFGPQTFEIGARK